MRRGFKAEAERRATKLREQLDLDPLERLPMKAVTAKLGVPVHSAEEFVDRALLDSLAEIQADAFSACTFQLPAGGYVIIFNPLHSPERIRSDIAHELSHLLLRHETRAVEQVGTVSFFTCDAEQEEEANWLAACLLVPRAGVVRAAQGHWSTTRIASQYQVSEAMARFRLHASGAMLQAARARRARAAS
jgi:Zn-dependent peptidase ImmA (M78 family)